MKAQMVSSLKKHFEESEAKRLAQYLMEDLLLQGSVLTKEEIVTLRSAMNRIIDGEPIQYVTGRSDFYGHQYYVDRRVLIPRPETEELVYQVIQYLKKSKKSLPRLLDIGTGSGCIPITIKKAYSACEISAFDISNDALNVAIQNANQLGVEVTFVNCDILSDNLSRPAVPLDVIISNPPYIPTTEVNVMGASTVKHEPHIALFTDDEYGLVFYQRIADLCDTWLSDTGAVFLELNEYHASKIKEIYLQQGSFRSVDIIDDMQGKPRILRALR